MLSKAELDALPTLDHTLHRGYTITMRCREDGQLSVEILNSEGKGYGMHSTLPAEELLDLTISQLEADVVDQKVRALLAR